MTMLRIEAPAKLNFFLHITSRRSDGYHVLESLAGFTAFGDLLEFAPDDTLSLRIEGPFAGQLQADMQDNLVLRAARALQEEAATKHGAAICLHKHIPMGAGLGGGSSDAAATLQGLARLWQLDIAQERLQAIALSLGSDVPVCLLQKAAWVSGVGEKLMPVEWSVKGAVLLVNPNIPLLTADVYRHFSQNYSPAMVPVRSVPDLAALVDLMQARHNALEAPAMALLSAIAAILSLLQSTQGCLIARMSGSGATCYGLYKDIKQAEEAAAHIKQSRPDYWVQATELKG